MPSQGIWFKDVLYFLNKADVVILLMYLPKGMYNLEENAFLFIFYFILFIYLFRENAFQE